MTLPRDRLLTAPETAYYLGLTVGALRTQRHRGQPPGILGIVVGRHLMFRAEDIERWLAELAAEQRAAASF